MTPEKETPTLKTVEDVANKLIEIATERADWFEPDAEVILATSAKNIVAKALTAQNQAADERLRGVLKEILTLETYFANTTLSPWDEACLVEAIPLNNIKTIAAKHGITIL